MSGGFDEMKVGRWADCVDSDDESVTTQALTASDETESLWAESERGAPLGVRPAELAKLLDLQQRASQEPRPGARELERSLRSTRGRAERLQREVQSRQTTLQRAKQRQTQLASENARLQSTLEKLLANDADESFLAQAEELLGTASAAAPRQRPPPILEADPKAALAEVMGKWSELQELEPKALLAEVQVKWMRLQQAKRRQQQLARENAQLEGMLAKLLADDVDRSVLAQASALLSAKAVELEATEERATRTRDALQEAEWRRVRRSEENASLERALRAFVAETADASLGEALGDASLEEAAVALVRSGSPALVREVQVLGAPAADVGDEVLPVARPPCRGRQSVRCWELCD